MSHRIQDKTIKQCHSWNQFVSLQNAQKNSTAKGDLFERLVQLHLLSSSQYKSKISHVWWPKYEKLPIWLSKHLNLAFPDEGIDLIAQTIDGDYWPIQAKYETDTSGAKTKGNLTSFTNAAFNYGEHMRLGFVAHTKAKPIKKRSYLESKAKGNRIIELGLPYWLELKEEDWAAIRRQAEGKAYKPTPRVPRDHQEAAIKKAIEHFKNSGAARGRLIMPCASGKSLTAYWIAQKLEAKSIIVAVPSLALIKQTVADWTLEYTADGVQPDWICVCSDKTTGSFDNETDEFVKDIYDLGLPVTTDTDIISSFLENHSERTKVIFTTYMSSQVLADAATTVDAEIDFCIFDEAHKTAGREGKRSTALIKSNKIKIKKRLFMTATERFLYGSNKNEKVFSMNDESVYGKCFHTLTFKEAIKHEIICDYKIITIAVTQPEIEELVRNHSFITDENDGADIWDAASIAAGIGLEKVLREYNVNHVISFHKSISSAKNFNKQQAILAEAGVISSSVDYSHVSSKQSAGERAQLMANFVSANKGVMTNARCLTEGVDIPAIDCVLFASPKQSIVDIVQAAGRAMRPNPREGKKIGYILIPITVPDGMDFEEFAHSTEFKVVARQISALSSQDERIAEYFRLITEGGKPDDGPLEIIGNVPVGMSTNFANFASAVKTKLWEKIGKINWRSFDDARRFARSTGISTFREWQDWSSGKSEKTLALMPPDIPTHPNTVYIGDWTSWSDWLGTTNLKGIEYPPFHIAKESAQSLGLTSSRDYQSYIREHKEDILRTLPSDPARIYSDEWISWGDWLGTKARARVPIKPFSEVRAIARELKLKNYSEWKVWHKAHKPAGIPGDPKARYEKEWNGWDDFLGETYNSPTVRKWRSFEDARNFSRSLGLKNIKEWFIYSKSGERPEDIPGQPGQFYKGSFVDWNDWLGNEKQKEYRSFLDARDFIRSSLISNSSDWEAWKRGERPEFGEFPADIPKNPYGVYKEEWLGWPDFCGTQDRNQDEAERLINSLRGLSGKERSALIKISSFRKFDEARNFARSLKLVSIADWKRWSKKESRPSDIPLDPQVTYRTQWIDWADWLGPTFQEITGKEARVGKREFRPFLEARKFSRSLHLESINAWRRWCSFDKRPKDIPSDPAAVYKEEWTDWSDWLGPTYKGKNLKKMEYRPFKEARSFVRTLGLKNAEEWKNWVSGNNTRLGIRPIDIPSQPHRIYKEDWLGYKDWLGTTYVSFEEAKRYVRRLGIKSKKQWESYKSGNTQHHEELPANIPRKPEFVYKNSGWKGFGDFFGTGYVATFNRNYLTYEEARNFVSKLGLQSHTDWADYCSGNRTDLPSKPDSIPNNPAHVYKDKGWNGFRNWLNG
ncbi:DEAD/DEAH box helicase family protein [Gammaproteobacteria bacterium]|nr:DEAD/DEAH box helicase family protein [Gammaproteobacteria bacterium]